MLTTSDNRIDPEEGAAVEQTGALLQSLGHTVGATGSSSSRRMCPTPPRRPPLSRMRHATPAGSTSSSIPPGGPVPGTVPTLTADAWMVAFSLLVHPVFRLVRAAHPWLARDGGAVLLVSSVAGLRGCPNSVAYQTVRRRRRA